ncbi:hypothetical protein GDO86_002719 [Hymenochirus boettgeri]|uniref:cullin-RING-type E3 NEDD8 transferase n=1 Tax=Hymenochirus boettgeri TaxID=247094 RepID=A0A8T2JY61_9PIPI|nr:hypothetical protein GDO86_002719 [Hymenochirus boettgeri]
MCSDLLKYLPFDLLEECWDEKFGEQLNFFISDSVDVVKQLKEANLEIFRCFIWFLDKNRAILLAEMLHILDKYFNEMDTPRMTNDLVPSVWKKPVDVPQPTSIRVKSVEEFPTKCIKVKNKHKKKKQNQTKPVYKVGGAVSTRPQDEDIFTEENTLSLLDPYEPFIVPEYLRLDVAEFENLYESPPDDQPVPSHLDNADYAMCETLYEYFSMILEEHGPLEINDDILIGEFQGFPEEARQLVEEAGGLKEFLLRGPIFVMVDELIFLQKHKCISDEASEKAMLNPAAKEFLPSSKPLNPTISLASGICNEDQSQENWNPPVPDTSPIFAGDVPSSILTNSPPVYSVKPETLHITFGEQTTGPRLEPAISNNNIELSSVAGQVSNALHKADKPVQIKQVQCNRSPETSNNGVKLRTSGTPPTPVKGKVQAGIVSVQVDRELFDEEVNTDPYYPFEKQQGDILRMEKEHLVLQDQLKDATEKYESLKGRYQEEIASQVKQRKETVEHNKITKKELDWLTQEQENETKKWQLEKKENHDKLRVLKNSIKAANETNDRYSREIEEKQKQYREYIELFVEASFNVENEKAKAENNIKKNEADLKGIIERAIAAEANVLENRKQTELLKLRTMAAKMENSASILRANGGTSSAQSLLQKSHLASESEKIKSQFDEQIHLVKNGKKLKTLTGAQGMNSVVDPPNSSVPPAQLQPPDFNPKHTGPTPPSSPSVTPNKASLKPPIKQSLETKKPVSRSKSKDPTSPAPPNSGKVTVKAPGATVPERQEIIKPDARHQSPGKPTLFDKIIDELRDIFPHYTSLELTNFIRDLRSKNGGSLAGLKQDDIVCRVTEYILDLQDKPAVQVSPGQININTRPSASGNTQVSTPPSKQPWRVVTTPSKNKWQKSNESESNTDEPCIICHDDLTQYPVQKLDCGHCFHKHCIKTWLNTQSTCPTCRNHALLPEDFPALSGRIRTA